MNDLIKINKKDQKKEKTLGEDSSPVDIFLPSFSLKKEELPEIKKWEVGETYEMKVKVKMTSYSENRYLEDKKENVRARFDIVGVEVEGKKDE